MIETNDTSLAMYCPQEASKIRIPREEKKEKKIRSIAS